MRYDEPGLVWGLSDHHALVQAGAKNVVLEEGGEEGWSALGGIFSNSDNAASVDV